MNLEALTQQELATLLCVDARTVRNAQKEGLPSRGAGKGLSYVWSEVLPWWLDRNLKVALSGRAAGAPAKEELRALAESERKKAQYEAEMAEMKAKKMKGELLDRAETQKTWSDFLFQLRDSLMGMPGRLAPRVMDCGSLGEVEGVLKDEITRSLGDVAGNGADHAA